MKKNMKNISMNKFIFLIIFAELVKSIDHLDQDIVHYVMYVFQNRTITVFG